jgi:preprotein translocase subunit SecG
MLSISYYLVTGLFLLVCLIMILLILIQKGRGGGLSSAFGGGGGNTAFGSKTGDVLTWATSIVFGVFLVLAIALNLLATAVHRQTTQQFSSPTNVVPEESAPAPTTQP